MGLAGRRPRDQGGKGQARFGASGDGTLAAELEAEYTAVFQTLYPKAYRVAYRILGNAAAAEDAAAEAFVRAYAAWDRVRALSYREAWVMKTTANVALNIASRKSIPRHPVPVIDDEDARATRLALVAALGSLSRRQREVVVLHHLAGFTEREVGEALGLSTGTVKTHLKRAMAQLREEFIDNGTTDEDDETR